MHPIQVPRRSPRQDHRSRSVRRTLLSAAVCLVFACSANADQPRWKFKTGQVLHYVMVQDTKQSMSVMGNSLKSSVKQTVDLTWKVQKVAEDGTAEMTQTIDRVRLKVDAPGNSFEFDTKDGKEPAAKGAASMIPMFTALVGADFALKMTDRGELKDVNVPEKVLNMIGKPGSGPSGGMFTEEGLKNMISQSSLMIPEGEINVGKTWSNPTKVPIPQIGTLVMDKTYTYKGAEAGSPGVSRITLATDVKIEGAADSNVAVTVSSHDGAGEFLFDTNAGRMSSSKVNDKMVMQISVMGQNINQETESITTLELQKD